VRAFFDHLLAGESERALECWAANSVWHITGGSVWAGDYSPAEYLAMGSQWYVKYPDYNYKMTSLREIGELTFFSIRSRGGEAAGEAEGMMIYRVADGLIVEGWAIPASHGGRYSF
jgi:predicted SnoaL-like aldol condensation-catalyzing enzyme